MASVQLHNTILNIQNLSKNIKCQIYNQILWHTYLLSPSIFLNKSYTKYTWLRTSYLTASLLSSCCHRHGYHAPFLCSSILIDILCFRSIWMFGKKSSRLACLSLPCFVTLYLWICLNNFNQYSFDKKLFAD